MFTHDSRAEEHLPLTTVAFEILLAVSGGECTGYEVMLTIEKRTAGRLSPNPGTLYRAIDRLVGSGLIAVREVGDDTPARRGGRVARMLRLSELGTRVLALEAERLASQVSAARAAAGSLHRSP